MRQFEYKQKALVCVCALIGTAIPAEAQEKPQTTEIFQRQERSRDIFSPDPTYREKTFQQNPQSAPQPPARGRLLGEDQLTPEMQQALSGNSEADGTEAALNASRAVRSQVENLTRSKDFNGQRLEHALKAVRSVTHQVGASQPPTQEAGATNVRKAVSVKKAPLPIVENRSGFFDAARANTATPFLPLSTLSLIVDGSDSKHVKEQLNRLANIAKNKNVKVGNVYIVGVDEFKSILTKQGGAGSASSLANAAAKSSSRTRRGGANPLDLAKFLYSSFYGFLEQAGLGSYQIVKSDQVLKHWNVSYSPTWIVRHKGRDFVFEGFTKPEAFFDREGEFIREDG